MGLFRRSERSSPSSSSSTSNLGNISGTATPTPAVNDPSNLPGITLTKTTSRLTKTLTWGRKNKEEKERRKIEDWEKKDEEEWCAPTHRPGNARKSKAHQDLLRTFEMKFGRESIDGHRSGSMFSGISPGCSRMGSVDDGQLHRVKSGNRKRSGGGPLSRETTRSEAPSMVASV